MAIENSLDQSEMMTRTELQSLDFINTLIEQAVQTKDPSQINRHISRIRRTQQIEGLALAKLLYMWQELWTQFEIGETFEDYVFTEDGISPQTTRKYIALWLSVFENEEIPDEVKVQLYGKPVQGLLLLIAVSRDHQMTTEDWEEVAQAPDTRTIREIVRRVRGEQTNSETALILLMDRDGMLKARKGDQPYIQFGYLDIKPTEPTAQQAIERVLRAAGILVI